MKRLLYIGISCILFNLQSCVRYTTIVDERGDNLELYDYYVDEYGNEGIVVYINLLETRVLVLSSDEQELPWGQPGQLLFDSLTSISSESNNGLLMLNIMYNHGIDHYPAQSWCMSKNNGGFPYTGSWRLPSHYEWKNFVCRSENVVNQINKSLARIGGVPLDKNDYYWTCTEDYENYWKFSVSETDYDPVNCAINESPLIRALVNKENWHKQRTHKVRAIKYVYYKD